MLVAFAALSDQFAHYLEGLLGVDADYLLAILRIIGINIADASKSFVPFACTNDCSSGSQKFVKISFRISSRVRCQTSRGPESERFNARRNARSKATQHITGECRNSLCPPRTSHIPSSGRRQFFPSHSNTR